MEKRFLCVLLFFLFTLHVHSQHEYQLGLLPKFNLSKGLSQGFKLNLKWESRQILRSGIFGENNDWNYAYSLTDFAAVLAKKSGVRSRQTESLIYDF